jgi:gas vesicle protein
MAKKTRQSPPQESAGNSSASWFVGLILGAFGGAVLALLTAPKSGSEIRGTIKRATKDIPYKFRDVIDHTLDLYAATLNYCQSVIEDQTVGIKRAVAAGKLAAAKQREELELGGTSVLPFQHR